MGKGKACSQDVGGPCCNKPQAVCFRSLAELTIENPPISSTFTLGGAEVAGMEGEGGARASPLLLLLLLLLLPLRSSCCFLMSSSACASSFLILRGGSVCLSGSPF